jgi:hypothetical protein
MDDEAKCTLLQKVKTLVTDSGLEGISVSEDGENVFNVTEGT